MKIFLWAPEMVFRWGGEWLLGLMLFGFSWVNLGEFVAYDISWACCWVRLLVELVSMLLVLKP